MMSDQTTKISGWLAIGGATILVTLIICFAVVI